ncbi:hypothetical protein GEMRC1_010191 [Eukaryota sp. GEM-RC1]
MSVTIHLAVHPPNLKLKGDITDAFKNSPVGEILFSNIKGTFVFTVPESDMSSLRPVFEFIQSRCGHNSQRAGFLLLTHHEIISQHLNTFLRRKKSLP